MIKQAITASFANGMSVSIFSVRYDVQLVGDQARLTRTIISPSRLKPPIEEMTRRMGEEVENSVANIKWYVDW